MFSAYNDHNLQETLKMCTEGILFLTTLPSLQYIGVVFLQSQGTKRMSLRNVSKSRQEMVGFLFHQVKGFSYSLSYVTVSVNFFNIFLALGSRNSLHKFPCVVPDTRVLTPEQEEAPQSRTLIMPRFPTNITVLFFCVSILGSRNK